VRAAILVGPGEIQLCEAPEPHPASHEVKIAVSHVGICGSDLARFEGRLPKGEPIVFGHEFSGRVYELGSATQAFMPGQPVTVAPLLNCGHCAYCLRGQGYLCAERRRFGADVPGALSDFVCVPAERVFELPKSLSLEQGALAEPLAVALHAVHQAGDLSGAVIAVLGGGAIGLLIAQAAHALGVKTIMVIDIISERVELAQNLGFIGINACTTNVIHSVLQHSQQNGVDLLFEASGSSDVAQYFLPLLAKLGTIVVVGRIEDPVPIDLDRMLHKEARLVASRYFSIPDFQQAVNMIVDGDIAVNCMIQKRIPFSYLSEDQGRSAMSVARKSMRLIVDL